MLIASGIFMLSAATPNDKQHVTHSLNAKKAEMQNASSANSAENQESFQPFTGKVCAHRVRLRVQPHLEAHIIKELNSGDLFAIVGEKEEYYVVNAPKNMKGYVFRTFILEDIVEGARVNVRLQPDTEAPIISQLNSGDRIKGVQSEQNNKWLEIDAPASTRFYIAKEYIEKIGPLDVLEKYENKRNEGMKLLNTALLLGQSELRKPFEEIDLNTITKQFDKLNAYNEITEIRNQVKEMLSFIQETYIQKKIAFLEAKTDRTVSIDNETMRLQSLALEKKFQDKFAELGMDVHKRENSQPMQKTKKANSEETRSSISHAPSKIVPVLSYR